MPLEKSSRTSEPWFYPSRDSKFKLEDLLRIILISFLWKSEVHFKKFIC